MEKFGCMTMVCASESLQAKTIGFKSDIADAMRFIDYARERGYDFQKLLRFEITSISYFLVSQQRTVIG